jgi:trehalose utilization protein
MGFVALHSAHLSKPFVRLLGTTATLGWRESGDTEILWNLAPAHPITQGIGARIVLEHEETYVEPFDIPRPNELIFASWFSGGEVFRSGVVYNCGSGRVFYFRPGHEEYPTFRHPSVQTVLANAVRWAAG